MITPFLAFLNTHQLLPPDQPVLVAVSGGLDSVVLLDLVYRAEIPMGIAHVNFGLRGAESDEDAAFVQSLAKRYNADFHIYEPEMLTYAQTNNLSVQMAARALRYAFFDQIAHDFGYGAIATAHHQDDLAETLLLNLARGTGLAGLHGIRPKRDQIIRPLLFTNRADIQQYANERGLVWREDSSNETDKYARNRIRHQVLPVLQTLNPSLSGSLTATANRIRAAEVLMQAELDRSWQLVVTKTGERTMFNKAELCTLSEPAFRLGEWLRPFGFVEKQTDALAQLLHHTDRLGQTFLSATHQLTNDRTTFTLEPIRPDRAAPISLVEPRVGQLPVRVWLVGAGWLSMEVLEKPAAFVPPHDLSVACLDADLLRWPLVLRPWQLGDRFQPLGMTGSKLVSDLLNDRKVSTTERANTWVLVTADGQIGWVVGHRLAQPVALSLATLKIIRLQLSLSNVSSDS